MAVFKRDWEVIGYMKKRSVIYAAVVVGGLLACALIPMDSLYMGVSAAETASEGEISASLAADITQAAIEEDAVPMQDGIVPPQSRRGQFADGIMPVAEALTAAQARALPVLRAMFEGERGRNALSQMISVITDPIPKSGAPGGAEETISGAAAVDPSKPMLALTFDDGPSAHTYRILDLLEKYGGRVTFCAVGYLVEARAEVLKRASDMGCEVIGHTWDHKQLTKLSSEAILSQLERTKNVIEAATGKTSNLYRPPYGALNDRVRAVSRDNGYLIIYWSVDTLDWKTRNADAVYKAVMKGAEDKAVILCHDLHKTTVDAMERVIPALLDKGFQLVTVSELLYYSGKNTDPGTVIYSG